MHDAEPAHPTLQTRWSMLDRLHGSDAAPAWSWFVERYRPAITATLEHWLGPARAHEIGDGFWGYLFDGGVLQRADRSRRFRHFLWGIARMYARKHLVPGREASLPAEAGLDAEARVESAESAEMRLWSARVLQLAIEAVRRDHPDDARAIELFYGLGDRDPVSAPELARLLDRKIGALHVLLHRARHRLRDRVVAELRETVRESGELDEEIALILASVQRDHPGLV
ncbi:MAG: sigma-70 family RNA polymerase sigma factor [Planctomycetes bacterium]|nr:sigma-70 family RNA polymerase sigma factor [Planctomycetota bacterium]